MRPWESEDAPTLVEAWADGEIGLWTAVPPDTSLAYAELWIAGASERELRRIAVDRAVILDGSVVGEVGLSSFDERRRAALLGYWIGPTYRGRGLASKAIAAFCEWAMPTLELDAVVVEVAVGNPKSRSAAERAGFTLLRSGELEALVLRSIQR